MAADDPTMVAHSLCLEGRMAEAEELYRKIIGEQPDDCRALEGLGALVFRQGRAQEAAGLFARAVAIEPDSARLHANLGEALRSLGRLDEALDHLRLATELDPSLPQAWNSLGLLASARGHHDYAETAHRESFRLHPNFVPGRINLANVHLARGRLNEAADELRKVVAIEPNNGLALMNLGRILAETREPARYEEAESLARRAAELLPQLPHAMINLAFVLRLRGRDDEARACDDRAREISSRRTAIAGQAGTPPSRDERRSHAPVRSSDLPGLAVEEDDPARDRSAARPDGRDGPDPGSTSGPAGSRYADGLVALKQGRIDAAEACFREAVNLDPTRADGWLKLARIREERGDFEGCREAARSALARDPRLADAYRMLAFLLRADLPDDDVRAMERRLADPEVSPADRARLRFGLAAVLDHRGGYAEAAAHLEEANALQASAKGERGLRPDPERRSVLVEGSIATFTPAFLARRRGWGDPDPRPVFVVGLPRSGTTLTEQILASHARVHGAGELHEVLKTLRALPEHVGQPGASPLDVLDRLNPDTTRTAARPYLERLNELAPPSAARVVDKQPDNFDNLGLIALLWPGARVIVCHRDPRDVALSCWQMGFETATWSNTWEGIASRIADHRRLLDHWRRTRPIAWLDLSYETLVTDLEGQARRMIDFLGLEWDPSCLEFHANRRVVRTPSLVQVRQPLHTRSVGRWRNYEPYLQPLLRAFERHGVDPDRR